MARRQLRAILAAFVLWALLGAVIWAFSPVPGLAIDGGTGPELSPSLVTVSATALVRVTAVARTEADALEASELRSATGVVASPVLAVGLVLLGMMAIGLVHRPDVGSPVRLFLRRGPPAFTALLRPA
jgi:hypothetical protein